MRHDDGDIDASGEHGIDRRTPTSRRGAARFSSRPDQIEILESLLERLAPALQWFCGKDPFGEPRIDLDREAQSLSQRGDRLLRASVGARHERSHAERFQVVRQTDGLGVSDGRERRRRLLTDGFAVTDEKESLTQTGFDRYARL